MSAGAEISDPINCISLSRRSPLLPSAPSSLLLDGVSQAHYVDRDIRIEYTKYMIEILSLSFVPSSYKKCSYNFFLYRIDDAIQCSIFAFCFI